MNPSSSVVWGAEPSRFLTTAGRNADAGIVGFRHADTGARQTARGPHVLGGGHAGGDGRDRHPRLVSLLIERSLVLDSLAGRPVSLDEAVASDHRVEAIGGWTLIALLVTAVLWCIWQHRAHSNLRAFSRIGLAYTPGWAVGWWFIPFASLWKPLGAMSELWKASEPTDDPNAWGVPGPGGCWGCGGRAGSGGTSWMSWRVRCSRRATSAPWHRATSSRWSLAWWRSLPPSARS